MIYDDPSVLLTCACCENLFDWDSDEGMAEGEIPDQYDLSDSLANSLGRPMCNPCIVSMVIHQLIHHRDVLSDTEILDLTHIMERTGLEILGAGEEITITLGDKFM